MAWAGFAAAWTAFLLTHFLPSRSGARDRLIAAMGRRGYFAAYGAVSLGVLAWLIAAAGEAPQVVLWWQAGWQRWVPTIAMPVAFCLGAAGMGTPWPHTLGGRRAARFDPAAPGTAAVSRHPLLMALALWAFAHVPPNGDLAHVILFGGFGLMALAAMPVFDRRARGRMPESDWRAVREATAILSLRPFARAGWLARNGRALAGRAAIGLALYALALRLHGPVIGAWPLPH